MRYTMTHRWGNDTQTDIVNAEQLEALLAELNDTDDIEHPDVSIRDNETGWSLGIFAGDSGLVVLEVVEDDDDIWHMRGLSPQRILKLCTAFASGTVDLVRQDSWLPGYQ